jgi:hypothetical protein
MFPLWLLQFLVIGALVLCAIGVVALIAFLVIDSRDQQIW